MSKREQPDHPELKHPSTKRAKEIDSDLPYDVLQERLDGQTTKEQVSKVVHWVRSKDLRISDNVGLYNASALATDKGKPLVCAYVNCAPEFAWHGTSPARVDFILQNLELMQQELKELNIPMVILDAPERKQIVPVIAKFVKDNDISHVFANYEYEVDELRRDTKFLEHVGQEVHLSLHHDQCVVEPGTMRTGTSLFDGEIPSPPEDKKFPSVDDQKRIRKLWPAGTSAGLKRMDDFISNYIEGYAATRSNPAKNSTSRMSAYFSAGVVSVRQALSKVKEYNSGSSDFSSSGSTAGVTAWVREVVFRELYRQTTLTTPHTVMNLPTNLKFEFVQWEKDEEGWYKWKEGKTGVPFVDAGMRQINHEAYMHNRLRMNVSSYLYCNLLLDYRRGERYFAETLIDWDLNNNTQGWEPSYTVFNPVSQAEKNDPDGDFIRKWVPELKDVKGKAVFDPYHRLSREEFEKLGYPKPHVDWKETKARAMERFKHNMADADP